MTDEAETMGSKDPQGAAPLLKDGGIASENPRPKLEIVTPVEKSLDSLWVDPRFNDDGLTSTVSTVVPIGKPKDFFRVHPNRSFRRRCEIYKHQPEGVIDVDWYLIDEPMWGSFEEAKPYTLCACVYRDGTPRLWPLRLASETDKKEAVAWTTAREAARAAIDAWVKLLWKNNSEGFIYREAAAGYAPDPAWERYPSFEELVTKAFGEKYIIRDTSHPVYRNLIGATPSKANGGDDL